MSEYADKILAMTKEIERLRDALRPFGEIGRRLGWVDMADDDPHLGDHIMDAPADDIAPGAFYCLMVGHFRDAATVPNGER